MNTRCYYIFKKIIAHKSFENQHKFISAYCKKRASADTQTGHRQRLFIRFVGIRISDGIDTYSCSIAVSVLGI